MCLLIIWQFLLLPQHPLVVTARGYGDLSCWLWNPGCWVVWFGARIPCSQGTPVNFFPPPVTVGPPLPPPFHATPTAPRHTCGSVPLCTSPPLSQSPPLLPAWMNVASLNPWLLDFHTVRFSDDSGWYFFCTLDVIFSVVVQGGETCLPTPPSSLEVKNVLFARAIPTTRDTPSGMHVHTKVLIALLFKLQTNKFSSRGS